jgi:hypothetical protein
MTEGAANEVNKWGIPRYGGEMNLPKGVNGLGRGGGSLRDGRLDRWSGISAIRRKESWQGSSSFRKPRPFSQGEGGLGEAPPVRRSANALAKRQYRMALARSATPPQTRPRSSKMALGRRRALLWRSASGWRSAVYVDFRTWRFAGEAPISPEAKRQLRER